MTKKPKRSPKAYDNLEFLNSPAARTIRILSEFLEPARRFRKEGITDTVVFFGSARVLPRAKARRDLAAVRRKLAGTRRPPRQLQAQLESAEMALSMSRFYEDACTLSFMLARWFMKGNKIRRFVVCSGGGPGIMEAANKGARKAGGKTVGLNISLPFEQESNRYVSPNLDFEFHYFFMRKFWFMYLAKALVMFPGGFGTMDELMEVLTLLQTGKVKKHTSIVLYGRTYWDKVLNLDAMVKHGTVSRRDLRLFRFADTPQSAFDILKKDLTRHYMQSSGKPK